MSEKFIPSTEGQREHVEHETREAAPLRRHEATQESTAERPHDTNEKLQEIVEKVEKHASSSEDAFRRTAGLNSEHSPNHHPVLISKQMKEMTYARTITRARKHMDIATRAASRVVHAPIIEQTSELASKTIARPMSLFWGSLFACFGSSALLWTTKRFGYEYNYLLLFILFALGIVMGAIIELGWHFLRRSKR